MQFSSKSVRFLIDAAGYVDELKFAASEVEEVHHPLVASLSLLAHDHERLIVLLAGPSGTGKTTLASLWAQLASTSKSNTPWCVLPMDGFHLPHKILQEKKVIVNGVEESMASLKGAPETFDLELLGHKVEGLARGDDVTWPLYDRVLHDPVPDAMSLPPTGVVIIEGLYLLLDQPGWRELRTCAHRGIFVEVPEEVTHSRVVARHMRGGRTREDAEQHWQRSDAVNTWLVNSHRHGIDLMLRGDASGRLRLSRLAE